MASLKSSYDTKKELLNDLQRELQDIGRFVPTAERKNERVSVVMSCTRSSATTVLAVTSWKKH